MNDLQQAIVDATDAGLSVDFCAAEGDQVQVVVTDGYDVVAFERTPDKLAATVDGARVAFLMQRAVGGLVERWFGIERWLGGER
jgi:hypothetical protein